MHRQKTGGRQKGTPNKRTQQVRERLAAETKSKADANVALSPLDLMLSIMRDPEGTLAMRAEMAKAAAPYCHARLSAIEHSGSTDLTVQPIAPPMAPREVVSAVKALLRESETAMDIKRVTGATDSERLQTIMSSGKPLPPLLFTVLSGDKEE